MATASTTPSHEVQVKFIMARSRKQRSGSEPKVEEAVARLKAYHALGKRLLKEHPPGRKKHAKDVIRLEADEHGLNADTVFKVRAFADSEKGYTDAGLKVLTNLCRKHNLALGFTFIGKFMTIPDAGSGRGSSGTRSRAAGAWGGWRGSWSSVIEGGTARPGRSPPCITNLAICMPSCNAGDLTGDD